MITDDLIKIKISSEGSAVWQLVATDIETGKILPMQRITLDVSAINSTGHIIANVDLVVSELDIVAYANIKEITETGSKTLNTIGDA
jgi:hypothetical protein